MWVATGSVSDTGAARPYLVPVSLAWIDERVVVAVEAESRTARNLAAHPVVRLGLGPTRDVVIIDAVRETAIGLDDAPPAIANGYAAQADWDPRDEGGHYLYLVLRPERIQAWREANELADRTLMRDGAWVV